ncbi:MAG: alpha/beta fold hydrolase [Bacteroidia bacterium]|nr:alpha/beta fold hydrolase [Bacteroidia bacterium]
MKKEIIFLLSLCFFSLNSQELSRRPLLGIRMVSVTAETQRVMNLPEQKGVLIEKVIANSTAEKAGFKIGDILLKLNNEEITTPEQAVKLVAQSASGQIFTYEILRDKELKKGSSTFEPMPVEKHEGIVMEYKAVKTVNGMQRLIVSRPPDNKKHPVLVFIGGIGCYSLDFPMDDKRSEVQLLNRLTREGYVCVRAEKPGVGDNMKCTPCNEVSFNHEIESYISAVNAIKEYSYVDSAGIFILGHSMGGVMAPVIAAGAKVKGIIAYGTIGSNFLEYLAKTRRTLALAYEMNPQETDDYIKDWCECSAYYFLDGLTTAQATEKKVACSEILSIFDLRSPAYNKELYALNIPGAWKNFNGKALLLWGENDFVASKEDHEIIAATVNYYHKGNAVFKVVKNSSHGMNVSHSMQEAVRQEEDDFNPEVSLTILSWLKSVA